MISLTTTIIELLTCGLILAASIALTVIVSYGIKQLLQRRKDQL